MKQDKKLTISEYELPVVIDEDKKGGYVATCPKWKDCFAQGDTLEEAAREIGEVAKSLIEVYQEEKLKIPLKLKKIIREKQSGLSFNFPLFFPRISYA